MGHGVLTRAGTPNAKNKKPGAVAGFAVRLRLAHLFELA